MNAIVPIQSVRPMTPWIWGFRSGLNTVAFWCSVRHHSTEKCTIGTSTNAISAAMALRFAAPTGSPGMRRSAR